jgi:thymidylate synthase
VGDFIWTGGDVHLYSNHLQQAKLQLSREPFALPQLIIKRKADSLFDYQFEDFELVNYHSHEGIKAEISV